MPKKQNKIIKYCLNCGVEFKVYPVRQLAKFCSNSCKGGRPKGISFSEEHKKKLSLAKIGHIPWNKGLPCSDKMKELLNRVRIRNHSQETKNKISETTKGKTNNPNPVFTVEIRRKLREGQLRRVNEGRHNNFKGGISPENSIIRNSLEYKLWRESIFKRDNYTCILCNKRGGEIHAHHIKQFALFPDLRLDVCK